MTQKSEVIIVDDGAIHEWFGLSYAQYLAIPRTVLQSMPLEWQKRFVGLLREIDVKFDWMPEGKSYFVQLRDDETGLFCHDNLADYGRGRRRLEK